MKIIAHMVDEVCKEMKLMLLPEEIQIYVVSRKSKEDESQNILSIIEEDHEPLSSSSGQATKKFHDEQRKSPQCVSREDEGAILTNEDLINEEEKSIAYATTDDEPEATLI